LKKVLDTIFGKIFKKSMLIFSYLYNGATMMSCAAWFACKAFPNTGPRWKLFRGLQGILERQICSEKSVL